MTCIYKRAVEPWECTQAQAEVVYRESLPESTCQSPLDYITSLMGSRTVTDILQKGVMVQQPSNYCCPSCGDYYYFGGNLGFLNLIAGRGEGMPSTDCPLTIIAEVETYLQLMEAFGYSTSSYASNQTSLNCIQSGLTAHPLKSDEWTDKGIIEYGSFENFNLACAIMETFCEADITAILDNGLVIQCTDDVIIIASSDTYLKFSEALSLP